MDIEEAALSMHSSNDAASLQPSKRANLFSFPPTQRNGLLDSPTSNKKRSQNQRLNLRASVNKLLDTLSTKPLKQAEAF